MEDDGRGLYDGVSGRHADLSNLPVGILLDRDPAGNILISFNQTGMRLMNGFLSFWLATWTLCGVLGMSGMIKGFEGSNRIPVAVFWVIGEAIASFMLLWILFGKSEIELSDATLTFRKEIFAYRKRVVIDKARIRRIYQIKDGGEDDDSFPSWGLKIDEAETHYIMKRQKYVKSDWLGKTLAKWAGIAPHSLRRLRRSWDGS